MIEAVIALIAVAVSAVTTLRYRSRANKYKHLYEATQKPRKHTSPAAVKAQSEHDKYLQIRSQILLRDGFRCRECNYYKHLEVHHIIPRSKGGTDDPNNLITLCQRCHRKKHGFREPIHKKRKHTRRNKRKKFKKYLMKHHKEIRVQTFPIQSMEDVHPHQEDHSQEAEAKRRKNYEKWTRNELNQLPKNQQ